MDNQGRGRIIWSGYALLCCGLGMSWAMVMLFLGVLGVLKLTRQTEQLRGRRNREIQPLDSREKIPAGCSGCKHLQGKAYGGNLFICAMHPYGREKCPDYE